MGNGTTETHGDNFICLIILAVFIKLSSKNVEQWKKINLAYINRLNAMLICFVHKKCMYLYST